MSFNCSTAGTVNSYLYVRVMASAHNDDVVLSRLYIIMNLISMHFVKKNLHRCLIISNNVHLCVNNLEIIVMK